MRVQTQVWLVPGVHPEGVEIQEAEDGRRFYLLAPEGILTRPLPFPEEMVREITMRCYSARNHRPFGTYFLVGADVVISRHVPLMEEWGTLNVQMMEIRADTLSALRTAVRDVLINGTVLPDEEPAGVPFAQDIYGGTYTGSVVDPEIWGDVFNYTPPLRSVD